MSTIHGLNVSRKHSDGLDTIKHQADPITPKKEDELWETDQLGDSTAEALPQTVFATTLRCWGGGGGVALHFCDSSWRPPPKNKTVDGRDLNLNLINSHFSCVFACVLNPPHTLTIRKRFDRARSIACESLVCAGSIAYDLIACRAIASDQDSLDIIGCSDDLRGLVNIICGQRRKKAETKP